MNKVFTIFTVFIAAVLACVIGARSSHIKVVSKFIPAPPSQESITTEEPRVLIEPQSVPTLDIRQSITDTTELPAPVITSADHAYQNDNPLDWKKFQIEDVFTPSAKAFPAEQPTTKPQKHTFWKIRYAIDYRFGDNDMNAMYHGEITSSGLDITFDTGNTFDWMISFDISDGNGALPTRYFWYSVNWFGNITEEETLLFKGLSGLIVARSSRNKPLQVYVGGGMGVYAASAQRSLHVQQYYNGSWQSYVTRPSLHDGAIGFKFVGGLDLMPARGFLLGIQANIINVQIAEREFSNTSLDFSINFSF